MRAQPRLRTPPSNPTRRLQHARNAEHAPAHAPGPRHKRHQTVEHHADVVEDVCGEPVALAFGVQRGTDTVREENCGEPRRCVLEGVLEERGCGSCGGVADSDSCFPFSVMVD